MPPTAFLVGGGTGRQGGAVVDALLRDPRTPIAPNHIYVITRNPENSAARKLSARGINLVPGRLDDPNPIFARLHESGVELDKTAVFLAQAHGPTELSDAQGFIDAAAASRVKHFAYSSVDRGGKELSDADPSYCKTFSDKYHIEKHLIATSQETEVKMNYTILRPVWFAENALWGFPGRLCMTGWRDNMKGKHMQVVVARDLGRWAVEALLRPDESGLCNNAVSIASDELSFKDVDDIFRQETGRPVGVAYGFLARFIIWVVKDLNTMFGFINEREYGADLKWLSSKLQPTSFREFVRDATRREKSA